MSVSEWGGDSGARVPGADVVASGSAAGDPEQSAPASGHDDSGQLRAAMAAVAHAPSQTLLGRDPITSCPSPHEAIERAVDALFTAGYRSVSEDDTTVDRLAEVMWSEYVPDVVVRHAPWRQQTEAARDEWLRIARAAVQALREGQA